MKITATGPAKTKQWDNLGTFEYYKLGKNGKEIFKQTPIISSQSYLYVNPYGYWSVFKDYTSRAAFLYHPSCEEKCPTNCDRKWNYYKDGNYHLDTSIKIECVD